MTRKIFYAAHLNVKLNVKFISPRRTFHKIINFKDIHRMSMRMNVVAMCQDTQSLEIEI